MIDRYLENRRLIGEIANASGVVPIFVWQPVPNHAYDEKYHLFSAGGYGRISSAGFGYDMMSERLKHHDLGTNFLWIAHLQLEEKKPLYVDKVHYSAYFSEKIAREISNQILEKSLLARI